MLCLYATTNFQIRGMVSDYAVILAILVFAAIDNAFHLQTPKLIVPTEFKVFIWFLHFIIKLLSILNKYLTLWRQNKEIFIYFLIANSSRSWMDYTFPTSFYGLVHVYSRCHSLFATYNTPFYGPTNNHCDCQPKRT